MAGIYEIKKDKNNKNKEYLEFAIITVSTNALMAKIHNRMPAVLLPEDEKRWLDPNTPLKQALSALRPYPANKMKALPVSNLVNYPANEGPDVIKTLDALPIFK